ncbi:MAG TPA: hypothetical protein V6D13_12465 [Halomicronema sp.]
MSHLNLKSLFFYAMAIGSVGVLFKTVSFYGETTLKAPPSIGGNYEIPLKSLVGCGSDKAVLSIHQSGIYLTASFGKKRPFQEVVKIEEKPEMDGKLDGQKLELSGLVEGAKFCRQQKDNKFYELTILAEIKENTLKGKLMLLGLKKPLAFTAKRQNFEANNSQTH